MAIYDFCGATNFEACGYSGSHPQLAGALHAIFPEIYKENVLGLSTQLSAAVDVGQASERANISTIDPAVLAAASNAVGGRS